MVDVAFGGVGFRFSGLGLKGLLGEGESSLLQPSKQNKGPLTITYTVYCFGVPNYKCENICRKTLF